MNNKSIIYLNNCVYVLTLTEAELIELANPIKLKYWLEHRHWKFMCDSSTNKKMFYQNGEHTILIPKNITDNYGIWLRGFLNLLCQYHHISMVTLLETLRRIK